MSVETVWERAKVEGKDLLGYVRRILDEGNARRIVIKQKGTKIVEFPLFAPLLAAVGAVAAIVAECTVEVEKTVSDAKPKASTSTKKARRSTGKRS